MMAALICGSSFYHEDISVSEHHFAVLLLAYWHQGPGAYLRTSVVQQQSWDPWTHGQLYHRKKEMKYRLKNDLKDQ